MLAGLATDSPAASRVAAVGAFVITSTTSLTRCGFILMPLLASVAVAEASCNMVKLL